MKQMAAKVLSLNFMGCLWGYIGMNLIRKGLPSLFASQQMAFAIAFTVLALAIGFFKSIFVLKKTANRLILRLDRVTNYFTIFKILDLKFFILIMAMMGLGIGLGTIEGLDTFKGVFRTAVGYGLLQSSFYFFKPAFIYGIGG
jgi:hypothetical protein